MGGRLLLKINVLSFSAMRK